MGELFHDIKGEFRKHKDLAEHAMAALTDGQFVNRPGEAVNPVAVIVKHMAGNLRSRWTDFLTSDGEKPDRNRDGEFILTEADRRAELMAAWERGWQTLFDALDKLTDADLSRTVTIRSEPLTVLEAILRALTHAAYHAGQITYVSRLLHPDAPWLTIAPPGQR